VQVRIITDNDKAADLGSDADRFHEAGIQLRVDHTSYHMHHKFAIFDSELLLNGSYNWTRSAAEHNEENFILTGQKTLIAAFQNQFETLWASLRPQE
jgi:cardiolipin hydrolase